MRVSITNNNTGSSSSSSRSGIGAIGSSCASYQNKHNLKMQAKMKSEREAAITSAFWLATMVLALAIVLDCGLLISAELSLVGGGRSDGKLPAANATGAAKANGKADSQTPSIRSRLTSAVPNYLDQMQNVLELAEHIQLNPAPGDEPKNWQSIRDVVAKTTDLIGRYQKHGLSNMPNLPNLPGLNTVLRTPDKVLRVELSMLQHLVLMAENMMENPVVATVNLPRDLATMVSRMADQVEQ